MRVDLTAFSSPIVTPTLAYGDTTLESRNLVAATQPMREECRGLADQRFTVRLAPSTVISVNNEPLWLLGEKLTV